MSDLSPSDDQLRALLARVRTIAVVGFSANPARPSHYVSEFLVGRGYRVVPVNPGLSGQMFFGVRAVAELSGIAEPVDMVDVFRRSDHVSDLAEQALALQTRPSLFWMQLGVAHAKVAQTLQAKGVDVVQNRCPKMEIPRLFPPGWSRG